MVPDALDDSLTAKLEKFSKGLETIASKISDISKDTKTVSDKSLDNIIATTQLAKGAMAVLETNIKTKSSIDELKSGLFDFFKEIKTSARPISDISRESTSDTIIDPHFMLGRKLQPLMNDVRAIREIIEEKSKPVLGEEKLITPADPNAKLLKSLEALLKRKPKINKKTEPKEKSSPKGGFWNLLKEIMKAAAGVLLGSIFGGNLLKKIDDLFGTNLYEAFGEVLAPFKNFRSRIENAAKWTLLAGIKIKDVFFAVARKVTQVGVAFAGMFKNPSLGFRFFRSKLTSSASKVAKVFSSLKSNVGNVIEKLKTTGSAIGRMIKNPRLAVRLFNTKIASIGNEIKSVVTNISTRIGGVIGTVKSIVKGGIKNAIKSATSALTGGFKAVIKGGTSLAGGGIKGLLKGLFKKIPVIGSLISAGLAYRKFRDGDTTGGFLAIASAIGGFIPFVGIGVSFLIDMLDSKLEAGTKGGKTKSIVLGELLTEWLGNIPIINHLAKAYDCFKNGDYLNGIKEMGKLTAIGWIADLLEWTAPSIMESVGSIGDWINEKITAIVEKIMYWMDPSKIFAAKKDLEGAASTEKRTQDAEQKFYAKGGGSDQAVARAARKAAGWTGTGYRTPPENWDGIFPNGIKVEVLPNNIKTPSMSPISAPAPLPKILSEKQTTEQNLLKAVDSLNKAADKLSETNKQSSQTPIVVNTPQQPSSAVSPIPSLRPDAIGGTRFYNRIPAMGF